MSGQAGHPAGGEGDPHRRRRRIVIVGGGFAGLEAAKSLRNAAADVLLIDRQNHHLFQPLLYQVATAGLSPAHIATPIRKVLRKQRNARVALAEVTGIDVTNRRIQVSDAGVRSGQTDWVGYDYLVLATGMENFYFGHEEWTDHAPGLKCITDALSIRSRFLRAFEAAEFESDPDARRRALTFVVVGGGPTGVELAGTMVEIARISIPKDFRSADPKEARVILVEGGPRVLDGFPEECSRDALEQLRGLGVEVVLNQRVVDVTERGVRLESGDAIEAACVCWAAGVRATPVGEMTGAETDPAGRVKVEPDLSIPGHREVFVAGDLAHIVDPEYGGMVPGMAPGAIQMGRYVGRIIREEVRRGVEPGGEERPPFRYKDKGMLATIGRSRAVAALGRWKFEGLLAWLLWVVVHIFFLIGFRNRLIVMIEWVYQYFFFDRGARLITMDRALRLKEPVELELVEHAE